MSHCTWQNFWLFWEAHGLAFPGAVKYNQYTHFHLEIK
jgi:hypothetical protein